MQNWWHEILNNDQHHHRHARSSHEYAAAIERRLDADVRRDLDALDSHGTTALHEAVKFKDPAARIAAIEALLRCGADINATDSHGKTALEYLSSQLNEVCAIYFLVRINLLAQLDLPIAEQNRRWYRQWHDNVYGEWQFARDDDGADGFASEIKKYAFYGMVVGECDSEMKALRETRVNGEIATLDRVASGEASDEQIFRQLDDLERVVKSDEFYDRFVDYGGLVERRYRKALFTRYARRKTLVPLAVRAVEFLFELPDLCNRVVVGYLSYDDIVSLIEALKFELSGEVPDGDDSGAVFEDFGQLIL